MYVTTPYATTRPYYRSSYMFVTRQDRPLSGLTLDGARLKKNFASECR